MIEEKNLCFHLYNENISYILTVRNGYLYHVYYGQALPDQSDFSWLIQSPSEPVGNAVFLFEGNSIDTLSRYRLEYPTVGEGDYREPALRIEMPDGTKQCSLKYHSHRWLDNKPTLKGLPATRDKIAGDSETLEITLADDLLGLTVRLTYTIFKDGLGLTRQATLINDGDHSIKIHRALSGSMDFVDGDFELTGFYGDWIKERQMDRQKIRRGIQKFESKKGVSSSWHNPFFMLARPEATEMTGEVFGFGLVYSGNFMAQCEWDPHDVLRVQMGISDFDFCWVLKSGESFETPEWLMTYSNQGYNGMSQMTHDMIRKHLVQEAYANKQRPVLINNWEATYFDFDELKLLNLAEQAAAVGVELFVLDDGWFKGRNDDTTSLGDWTVDLNKLPAGLKSLSEKIKAKGLEFGIWVEPEMVSMASDLYLKHPDWVIAIPGRPPKHGRNQFILDLSREDVVAYLYQVLTEVFTEADVSYVKWDMNRTFSDLYSSNLSAAQQGELTHRYVLGLYRLMDQLIATHPDILFEFCASGGNRFDLGMLYYMPQGWTSDNTDALERQYIQYATSYAYPPSTMGAHVSAVPNHQTGRMTPLMTRYDVAAFGVLGYELDLTKLSDEELETIRQQIATYKVKRAIYQFGRFYRLKSPFEGNVTAWMSVSEDQSEAIVGYYKKLTESNPGYKRLKLTGLSAHKIYKVSGAGVNGGVAREIVISGAALMTAGLPLRPEYNGTTPTSLTWWFGDLSSAVFELKEVK